MADMISFCESILSMIPDFLMSEPIKYVTGLIVLSYVIRLFFMIRDINKY